MVSETVMELVWRRTLTTSRGFVIVTCANPAQAPANTSPQMPRVGCKIGRRKSLVPNLIVFSGANPTKFTTRPRYKARGPP
eukprot:scaffold150142_cov42-Attheya_sp.AAC.2